MSLQDAKTHEDWIAALSSDERAVLAKVDEQVDASSGLPRYLEGDLRFASLRDLVDHHLKQEIYVLFNDHPRRAIMECVSCGVDMPLSSYKEAADLVGLDIDEVVSGGLAL